MKAIVLTQYGSPDVLQLKQVEKPLAKNNEILVKIYARPVGYGDLMARNFKNVSSSEFNMPFILWLLTRIEFGTKNPKKQILGSEFAGKIEAIGEGVTRFKVGDDVFGYQGPNFGTYAEYLSLPESAMVALKPDNMTYQEACTVPYGALTALNLLRKMDIQAGQRILINGASGSIGSAAVQLAKHLGAEVTGVCSTPRIDFVKALGADAVIDYTQEDFTQNGEKYDLVFDILGRSEFAKVKHVLKPEGRYLLASFKMKQLLQMLWTSIRGGKKVICSLSMEKIDDLITIKDLIEAGKIKAIIDQCYPMEDAAEAHRYAESGNKQGAVVLVS